MNTDLANATSTHCFQTTPGGPCTFTLKFVPRGFAFGTTFRVVARTVAPEGPWVLGADPVPIGGTDAPSFDATLMLTSPRGGPPAQVQFAVLAFASAPTSPSTEFQLLQQTAAAFAFVAPVLAVDVVVGNGDPSACTEEVLATALAAGSVTFNCGADPATITITHGLTITTNTDIDGGNRITFSGGDTTGVQMFYVRPGGTLHLRNAVLSTGDDNTANATAIYNDHGKVTVTNATFTHNNTHTGAAIYNSDGSLAVLSSTFSENSSWDGSTIYNVGGPATVTNSTFTHNSSPQEAGAIFNHRGTLSVTNSTFAENSSSGGGAIYNPYAQGTVTLTNTVVASNAGGNCGGAITDGGHNLRWPTTDTSCAGGFGDPQLAPLGGNGGPTQTLALGAGSAAIEAGDDTVCAAAPVNHLDQRGFVRPAPGASHCSIGAYEYNSGTACGADFCVFPAVCVDAACVVAPPAATASPTTTPTPTAAATATNTPGADDCCQCPSSCAMPVDGTCGSCTVVFGTTCYGELLCVLETPTPLARAAP